MWDFRVIFYENECINRINWIWIGLKKYDPKSYCISCISFHLTFSPSTLSLLVSLMDFSLQIGISFRDGVVRSIGLTSMPDDFITCEYFIY